MKRFRVSALVRVETFTGETNTIESRRTVVVDIDQRKMDWKALFPLIGLIEAARPLFVDKEKKDG